MKNKTIEKLETISKDLKGYDIREITLNISLKEREELINYLVETCPSIPQIVTADTMIGLDKFSIKLRIPNIPFLIKLIYE